MNGTERIGAAFTAARDAGRAALMPYMMGGFPDQATAAAVAGAYADAGCDLVELGVPFSDPLADGPVIHAAATRALEAGSTFETSLAAIAEVANRVPVVAMVYANMVLSRGPGAFAAQLADAGIAGAIVPDLPPEEAESLSDALAGHGLALIPLIAPTTPPARRAEICAKATGFVYVVSDTRTTGERDDVPARLDDLVRAVKAEASVPAAVGFGIGTPGQAAEVGRIADGVIVGSRLVRAVAESGGADEAAASVAEFLIAARQAMASPPVS
ncbi:MAG: tryptophan synthase subunit alpha [Actinomycetota bacterium]|nr:tryptophan synthase subunit alpha [Actinomycetota bacterium]